jgi:hypothetical protein
MVHKENRWQTEWKLWETVLKLIEKCYYKIAPGFSSLTTNLIISQQDACGQGYNILYFSNVSVHIYELKFFLSVTFNKSGYSAIKLQAF